MLSRPLVAATIKPIALSILFEGEIYGYQIIDRIQKLSQGKISLTTGTLYPFLHRLEADGLVDSSWKDVPDAPRRKYYRLTPKGRRALEREKRQWLFANEVLARLWGPNLLLGAAEG